MLSVKHWENIVDDAVANTIRTNLDSELSRVGANVGVFFGQEVFNEFCERKWITLETFSIAGAFEFDDLLPVYNQTHLAIVTPEITGTEFSVGKIYA